MSVQGACSCLDMPSTSRMEVCGVGKLVGELVRSEAGDHVDGSAEGW